jgi:hypothetical protein
MCTHTQTESLTATWRNDVPIPAYQFQSKHVSYAQKKPPVLPEGSFRQRQQDMKTDLSQPPHDLADLINRLIHQLQGTKDDR